MAPRRTARIATVTKSKNVAHEVNDSQDGKTREHRDGWIKKLPKFEKLGDVEHPDGLINTAEETMYRTIVDAFVEQCDGDSFDTRRRRKRKTCDVQTTSQARNFRGLQSDVSKKMI